MVASQYFGSWWCLASVFGIIYLVFCVALGLANLQTWLICLSLLCCGLWAQGNAMREGNEGREYRVDGEWVTMNQWMAEHGHETGSGYDVLIARIERGEVPTRDINRASGWLFNYQSLVLCPFLGCAVGACAWVLGFRG